MWVQRTSKPGDKEVTLSSVREQPTPALFPGEFRGQRSLAGYCPQGCKGLDMTEGLTL